jgi:hypothetical protein
MVLDTENKSAISYSPSLVPGIRRHSMIAVVIDSTIWSVAFRAADGAFAGEASFSGADDLAMVCMDFGGKSVYDLLAKKALAPSGFSEEICIFIATNRETTNHGAMAPVYDPTRRGRPV